ncbi:MAG: hypothetical protein J2P54_09810 [Bradyrhizobiaceae bacterium]|nr:hypothetical protein [Bradyrhizobiaceae bacterium]
MSTLWRKILMAIGENVQGNLPAVVIWRVVIAIVLLALLYVIWRHPHHM